MRFVLIALAALLAGLAGPASAGRTSYDVDYVVAFEPEEGTAAVTIRVRPGSGRLDSLTLRMGERYTDVEGDGGIERRPGDRVHWAVPREGGELRYRYRIDHRRRDGGYDARITERWAIVRGDDLVPSAVSRTSPGADSRARLYVALPEGWTNADTPFVRSRDGRSFVVTNADRRFDRPVGWIIAGDVGTRRERVEGTEFSIAAPKGDEMRRVDALAFLTLMAPHMREAFGALPTKLLVVAANDPMWRGGLSGPRSLYMHADRPLIGEDGTSTLVHELTHVITRIRGGERDDWIAEGIAEYYAIQLPWRAGLTTESRMRRTMEFQERRSRAVRSLRVERSAFDVTARAVVVMAALDAEIREATDGAHSLDDVVQALMRRREVDLDTLREAAEDLIGGPAQSLLIEELE